MKIYKKRQNAYSYKARFSDSYYLFKKGYTPYSGRSAFHARKVAKDKIIIVHSFSKCDFPVVRRGKLGKNSSWCMEVVVIRIHSIHLNSAKAGDYLKVKEMTLKLGVDWE